MDTAPQSFEPRAQARRGAIWVCAAVSVMVLAACAGGGGGGGAPMPTPTPTTPPPSPTASDFETTEYSRGTGFDLLGVSTAYAAGGTGEGQVIAIVDTGIDTTHPELQGRISDQSTDLFSGERGVLTDGPTGHGTLVAGVIAATKDDAGIHGLAFEAQVLAVRADRPGSCEASSGCQFFNADIAAAVDYAVAADVDVINLSLGGSTPGNVSVNTALAQATDAGILVVGAAGNADRDVNGDFLAPDDSPQAPGSFAGEPEASGLALVVGAYDLATGDIAEFSARAGDLASVYLLAPGVAVGSTFPESSIAAYNDLFPDANLECSTGFEACYLAATGTSFATPYVASALAMLLDAFPNLQSDPAMAVQILIDTAEDLGEPGLDPIYGAGLIDLEAAFSPVGASMVALAPLETGSEVGVDAGDVFAAPTGAFGDWAFSPGAFGGVIARDNYSRPFALAPTASAIGRSEAAFSGAAAAQRADVRAERTAFGYAVMRMADTPYVALTNLETDRATTPELRAAGQIGAVSFAVSRGAPETAALGRAGLSTTTLGHGAWSNAGLAVFGADASWTSARYAAGAWRLGVRQGDGAQAHLRAVSAARQLGAHWLTLEYGESAEDDGAFGSSVMARLGGEDAATAQFATLDWAGPVIAGWRGAARMTLAEARLSGVDWADVVERPAASAWALGAERALGPAAIGFTLAQPLRAETGAVMFHAPVALTEDGAGDVFTLRRAGLTPSGRELQLEAALRLALGDSFDARIAARHAMEPGHIAAADADTAVWIGVRTAR